MGDELVLTSRWVFPVSAPPIADGTVTIRGERIIAVEPRGSRSANLDLGNSAIIPGLVNAHTHLDLSGLRNKVPPSTDFTAWLKSIIAVRRQQTAEQVLAGAQAGLFESLQSGTTLIGDIAAGGSSWPLLVDAPCCSTVFHEILGLPHQRAMSIWKNVTIWLDAHPDTDRCRAGLSPHAPYSVHNALFRAAGISGAPLTVHLGESAYERELLEEKRGPFADFLREVGVWDEDALAPSSDWITWRSEPAPSLILAHGNYLDPGQPLPRNTTIVYCPRTHAAFGHPPHPFREFLKNGVRIALGTDSLASNPDLDVLAEARFVHQRYPDFPGDQLLRMATMNGAAALGWDTVTGSLEAGKFADLVVVPLPEEEVADPHALLFAPPTDEKMPRRSMWRGNWR